MAMYVYLLLDMNWSQLRFEYKEKMLEVVKAKGEAFSDVIANIIKLARESFENIFLDLSKESGRCRFAETGFGWKPSSGGDTFTLESSNIAGAQWSKAAKGFEVKLLLRNGDICQLDGFLQDVSILYILELAHSF